MRSIQRRLSMGLVAVLVVCGLSLILVSQWLVDHALRGYLRGGLQTESENLLIALVRGPNGLQLDEQRLNPAYQRPFSGRYFEIHTGASRWRSRSLWDSTLAVPSSEGLAGRLVDGPDEQRLLVYRANYQRFGQSLTLIVAQDYNPLLASFNRMLRLGAVLGLVALVIILLLQRLTVRNALRPLETVRRQIVQLQQGQRAQLDNQVPLELEPLVSQINHLLRHTEDNLKRARHGIGNLGHALKTPLAVLVSMSARDELAQHPDVQQTLREQLDYIRQRLEHELRRARLAGDQLPGVYLDCDAELPTLCSLVRHLHGAGLFIDCQVPVGLKLPWDREDMLELLGNLLDNAGKWAHAQIRLVIQIKADHYLITVDDDGPGVPATRREEILNRGARLDEHITGHGLGLSIVRDIVDSCGGTLTLAESSLGGLHIQIILPLKKRSPLLASTPSV
ncbi:signal transduction histidine kinase [Pseudomonas duriflava]|uniref:histidine kinase n=1 Tax=Pseudomonas duriflava TaxID=459528 RepID=A0A562Q8P0_9PSED|nr:sensor histidine kinase [Pseudomonas duriflava]TWI53112.1 signal transduction histidine kinase [Pseudomonas duriflava]